MVTWDWTKYLLDSKKIYEAKSFCIFLFTIKISKLEDDVGLYGAEVLQLVEII